MTFKTASMDAVHCLVQIEVPALRKTPAGMFTQPLYAKADPADVARPAIAALQIIAHWPITDETNMDAVNMRAVARKALAAPALEAPAHQSFNSWFLSLPEGRQDVLRDDKWMLASAAYEAGRESRSALEAPAAPMSTYVEVNECSDCGHIGINDADGSKAACITCDWQGDSPSEDKCPGCKKVGTMTSACPECGARTSLIAQTHLLAAAPQAQHQGMAVAGDGAAELGKLIREQWDTRSGIYPDGNPNSGQP